MGMRRTIAKNALVMLFSQAATWALTFLLTIFIPRYLGAAAVGKLHLANSIWAIVAIVAAFGMDILLTKEIARSPSRLGELAASSIALRMVLFALGFGGVAAFLHLFGYPAETRRVVYVVGLSQLIWQVIGVSQAALQGLEHMEIHSLGNVVGKAANTTASIVLLLLGQGVIVIASVSVLAALVNAAIQGVLLRRLDARRALTRAQAGHAQARYDHEMARLLFEQATGALAPPASAPAGE